MYTTSCKNWILCQSGCGTDLAIGLLLYPFTLSTNVGSGVVIQLKCGQQLLYLICPLSHKLHQKSYCILWIGGRFWFYHWQRESYGCITLVRFIVVCSFVNEWIWTKICKPWTGTKCIGKHNVIHAGSVIDIYVKVLAWMWIAWIASVTFNPIVKPGRQ